MWLLMVASACDVRDERQMRRHVLTLYNRDLIDIYLDIQPRRGNEILNKDISFLVASVARKC